MHWIPDQISKSLVATFELETLTYFVADPDPGLGAFLTLDPDPGWKNSDPVSGINIPDPQPYI
jgi:hypothetical protein